MANILNLPDLRPSLLLDFANSRQVDPRITFSRASTATRWNASGVLETVPAGVPRIDHDPETSQCLGLLVEEASTNLKTNSRRPIAATGTAIGAMTTIAPDGLPIEAMVETTDTGEHYVSDHIASNVSVGDVFTQSIYVKKLDAASVREVVLRVAAANDSGQVRFTIRGNTCAMTALPAGFKAGYSRASNGWWRVWITWTVAVANASATIRVQIHNDTQSSYAGDPAQGIFLFGRQVEAKAFPTSYISAGASAVTRAAESVSMPVTAMTEGTLLLTCTPTDPVTASGNRSHLSLSDGSSSNFARLNITGAGSLTSSVTKNGAHGYGGALGLFQAGTTLKRALAFSNADAKHCTNGVLGAPSDGSYQGANSMNQLWLGSLNGSQGFNGTLARVAVYSKRLSDAQLQRLTS